jgi:hypothetical protein
VISQKKYLRLCEKCIRISNFIAVVNYADCSYLYYICVTRLWRIQNFQRGGGGFQKLGSHPLQHNKIAYFRSQILNFTTFVALNGKFRTKKEGCSPSKSATARLIINLMEMKLFILILCNIYMYVCVFMYKVWYRYLHAGSNVKLCRPTGYHYVSLVVGREIHAPRFIAICSGTN